MRRSIGFAILVLALCLPVLAQDPAIAPLRPLPTTPAQQQDNAASANQDTSATSGDQITKPAGAKGSTLIGCLAGPDKDGKFTLRNMAHRFGVQVVGPNDLKNDSGSKVKLTGQWQPLPQSQEPVASPQPENKKTVETHRFQATDVEVLAQKCTPPTETTPVSKNKPQKTTTYNAPSSDDSK
ncbi:MAG: hypothetical protein ACLPPV_06635 [Candidatus Korobacteraceae bacterium]|jgi:hypothetical protein